MSKSSDHQRDRYLTMGLVQINAWVPREKRNEILEDCARLRWEHIRWYEKQQEQDPNEV